MTTKGQVALGIGVVVLAAGVGLSATYEHARAVGKRCIVCHDTKKPSLDDLNAAAKYYLANGTLEGYKTAGEAKARKLPVASKMSGQAIYQKACAGCHGAAGQGASVGKPITGTLMHGNRPEQVAAVVRDGIKDTMMIAFKSQLTEQEIQTVAKQVLSLQQVKN